MKFGSTGSSDQLRPVWEYDAGSPIWRFVLAPSGEIVGEARDTVRRGVSFFCLEPAEGSVRWSGVTLREPWWIGIEHVGHGVVLLHEYEVPNLPKHKRLHALDLASGSSVWESQDGAFWFARGTSVFTVDQTFERRRVTELDLPTGRPIREYAEDDPTLAAIRQSGDDGHASVALSLPEVWDGEEPPELRDAFRRAVGKKPATGEVGLLRFGGCAVMSWFENVEPASDGTKQYACWIAVWDESRNKMIYEDRVCGDAGVAAGDVFLVADGRLLYVRDSATLVAVSLRGTNRAIERDP